MLKQLQNLVRNANPKGKGKETNGVIIRVGKDDIRNEIKRVLQEVHNFPQGTLIIEEKDFVKDDEGWYSEWDHLEIHFIAK